MDDCCKAVKLAPEECVGGRDEETPKQTRYVDAEGYENGAAQAERLLVRQLNAAREDFRLMKEMAERSIDDAAVVERELVIQRDMNGELRRKNEGLEEWSKHLQDLISRSGKAQEAAISDRNEANNKLAHVSDALDEEVKRNEQLQRCLENQKSTIEALLPKAKNLDRLLDLAFSKGINSGTRGEVIAILSSSVKEGS